MMEESKISPDVLESLNKALYGSAFGNYDTAHPFLDRKVNTDKEESPTLSDKITAGDDTRDDWVTTIPFGGVLYDHIYRGIRTKDSFEKLYGVDLFPYQWAWFCGTTDSQKAALKKLQDKNKVRLEQRKSEKKEAAKPTCADCAHQDTCVASTSSWSSPCLSFQAKSKSQADGCADQEEAAKPTCADCDNQDPCQVMEGSNITLCIRHQVHVPLSLPACGDFVQASKGESEQVDKEALAHEEFMDHMFKVTVKTCNTWADIANPESDPEPNETLQEKTKTIAETISDLYYQIASLDSQKEALKSANEELKDLVLNCPACDSHVQEIDALNDENEKLCDTFLEQDVKLRKELLAEKSWRIGMNGKLENRDSLIDDLRNHIDLLVKGRERMLSEINAHCLASERESEVIANLQRRLHEQSKEIEAHCKIADNESEIIANLQRRLQAEVKENEILKGSLRAAESALELAKEREQEHGEMLKRGEREYLQMYAIACRKHLSEISLTSRFLAEEQYRKRLQGK
jgi:hypothetical protein